MNAGSDRIMVTLLIAQVLKEGYEGRSPRPRHCFSCAGGWPSTQIVET